MKALIAFVALGTAAGVAVGLALAPSPRLVGYGCNGASSPIYANEESDFPFCAEIKGN